MVCNTQEIGQRIKHFRKVNSLTQKELAAQIGVAPLYIANVEQGRKGMSVEKLVDICERLNITPSDILTVAKRDDSQQKEIWIEEIVTALRELNMDRVGFLRTMVCSTMD
jgi:transcriptional regulator with XRE-family HTH domain